MQPRARLLPQRRNRSTCVASQVWAVRTVCDLRLRGSERALRWLTVICASLPGCAVNGLNVGRTVPLFEGVKGNVIHSSGQEYRFAKEERFVASINACTLNKASSGTTEEQNTARPQAKINNISNNSSSSSSSNNSNIVLHKVLHHLEIIFVLFLNHLWVLFIIGIPNTKSDHIHRMATVCVCVGGRWNCGQFKFSRQTQPNEMNRTYDCAASAAIPEGIATLRFQILIYLAYTAIFLVSIVGNVAVFLVVAFIPRMQTVTNYFIANLAVGDILMTIFCIPFSFVSIFVLQYWPFGAAICQLVNYSQAISVLISAYTMIAISADRYIAIMYPFRPRVTKKIAKFLILLVWTGALFTAAPIPVFSTLIQPTEWYDQCDLSICTEVWPDDRSDWNYSITLITLQFLLPLVVLVFTYSRIAFKVWAKIPPGESVKQRDQRILRSKRKMIKMMITVVLVFTVCWLPFNIFMLIPLDPEWRPLPYLWFLFHWLAMSHSCYNPIIYCYMNEKFRHSFLHLVRSGAGRHCCKRSVRRRSDASNSTEMMQLFPSVTMLTTVSLGASGAQFTAECCKRFT
ncbi:RYamide receptor-like [Sabethes cyaneus]|uniref:RYamide receptor-like n=1 Tax=Sabethes cyaneus TaxID=53552 RepID=UPI00237DCB77|nr:RYamide receptor-like [Sabethes cyaneus]